KIYEKELCEMNRQNKQNSRGMIRSSDGSKGSNCHCKQGETNNKNTKTIVSPAKTVVNNTTTNHTIKKIHPTNVMNVNHDVFKIENYYPVTESSQNVKSV